MAMFSIPGADVFSSLHLIVNGKAKGIIDYWPGTGLWIVRKGGITNRGIGSLLRFLNTQKS